MAILSYKITGETFLHVHVGSRVISKLSKSQSLPHIAGIIMLIKV